MAPAKSIRGRDPEDGDMQSNNLWVGSLSTDTTESDLAELFEKYGQLDSITSYSSRSFAFIYYRRVEDAAAAKQALQGCTLKGHQIKIQFARPAKPCKSLWVGGISSNVSKEEVQAEFRRFGEIEDFRFLRERNTAFVDYLRLEDAIQAAKNMNGRRMAGEQLRVDFLRSHASKKEQWHGSYDSRDSPFRSIGPFDGTLGARRGHTPSFGDRKGDGPPSNVLWIGYPPSVQIDEQMLHNAMILFGEIERITSYPSRHYSFVEFRSMDEARRAKEGLQGRLFNDPRITIMYSNSELAPGRDDAGIYSGAKRSRPEMAVNEPPFRSAIGPGPLTSGGMLGPMRPLGRQGMLEHLSAGAEYGDPKDFAETTWRRTSPPGSGILPSPAQGLRLPMRRTPVSLDAYDPSQLEREGKRSRRDGSMVIDEERFPVTDDRIMERPHGLGPLGAKVTPGGPRYPDGDYIWRGIIAKGGTPVCHARCVPIGKGIETELPGVVNCSARTGLDMLAKHYAEAIGFEIVFFLPDSEDDFASYTEFLRYLGSKNRAGVAKFDDGTTLFLVPPSDFLAKVLKVSGPERLYGVVLKLPPPVPSAASFRQESHSLPSSYVDQRRISPSDHNQGLLPAREAQVASLEHSRELIEDSKPSKLLFMPTSEPFAAQSGLRDPPPGAAAPQAGVSLTPELIASLTTLLPTSSQSSIQSQSPLGTSTVATTLNQSVGQSNRETLLQAWHQDQPTAPDPMGHSFQQFGGQYNPQAQLPPAQHYPSMILGSRQYQDSNLNLPQQAALQPQPNFAMFSQGLSHSVNIPVTQQYQPEAPTNSQNYMTMHGTDPSGLHTFPAFQHVNDPTLTSSQVHGANPSQPQNVMPVPSGKPNLELAHVQQLQSALSGASQGTADGEVDKNERYQSTLQFAANLLLQIQQQQQRQSNAPGGPGTGSQL